MSSISHEMRRDAQKSPEELEHEINATRAELEDTLEELEARFSPNELFNQALSRVREHGGEFTQNLGDSIKQNPLPTLLTSIGIAWLMAANGQRADGDNGAGSLRRRMHDTRDAMHRGREKMSAARERASSTVQRGQESMREGMDSMREGIESSRAALARSSAALRSGAEEITSSAREVGGALRARTQSAAQSAVSTARGATSQARRQARRARIGAQQMLADQPLLLGALGLAAGALLGAAMPATEQEDRSIGRLRDRALEKAKGAGAEGMRRAREKAEQLASEGREALMDEGQRANEGRTDADRSAPSAEAAASSEPSSRIPSDGPSTGTERTGDLHAETDVRVTTPQAPGS